LQLFGDFDRAGLRWALLRPWQGLCSSEGDIDVLMSEEALDESRRILLRAGYLQMRADGEEVHAATFDPISGRFLWVHVQPTLKVGGVSVGAGKLLDNVLRQSFPELASEWLMWTLLVRAMEKQQLPERYRDPLKQFASDWSGGPAELEELVRSRGIDTDALAAAAAAGDWEYIIAQDWPREKANGDVPRLVTQARRVWRLIRALLAPQRCGLCVAIIGPDGAGKSTLVRGLERTLPLRTRRIYMGLTGGKMHRAQSLRVPGVVFAAQAAVLWTRYVQAVLYRAAGQIVLFDRYVLDGAVAAGKPLSPLPRVSRRVLRWIVPTPNLVLLLDASGRTMYARKGEYAAETLESWRTQYRRLATAIPSLVVVDAEQSAAGVLRTAQTLIWEKLCERIRV
jgi:thymidylate kinase